jgi:nucleotide-binding universal stress UspA family protein
VTTEVLRGNTVPAVLACSRRTDADLLVLATHGRAGIEAILAGSVAPRVTERALPAVAGACG